MLVAPQRLCAVSALFLLIKNAKKPQRLLVLEFFDLYVNIIEKQE